MPHLRFRGLQANLVQKLSEDVHEDLAKILKTSPENFTFELVATQFFAKGRRDDGYPFIEVVWFERGPEARQAVATYLTDRLRSLGDAVDIAVVFLPLPADNYFENAKHF